MASTAGAAVLDGVGSSGRRFSLRRGRRAQSLPAGASAAGAARTAGARLTCRCAAVAAAGCERLVASRGAAARAPARDAACVVDELRAQRDGAARLARREGLGRRERASRRGELVLQRGDSRLQARFACLHFVPPRAPARNVVAQRRVVLEQLLQLGRGGLRSRLAGELASSGFGFASRGFGGGAQPSISTVLRGGRVAAGARRSSSAPRRAHRGRRAAWPGDARRRSSRPSRLGGVAATVRAARRSAALSPRAAARARDARSVERASCASSSAICCGALRELGEQRPMSRVGSAARYSAVCSPVSSRAVSGKRVARRRLRARQSRAARAARRCGRCRDRPMIV